MLLKIQPLHPSDEKIQTAVNCLKKGGLIVFPTDTVYAIGGDLYHRDAIDKLKSLSGKRRPDFSIICSDLSQISQYTMQLEKTVFREMKKLLPGAFTFVLNASAEVTKLFGTNRKTIGIRIPDNKIALKLVEALGNPVVSTSLHDEDEIIDYMTDAQVIENRFRGKVDLVIDGGPGHNHPSTVIDFTSAEGQIIRQGLGIWK